MNDAIALFAAVVSALAAAVGAAVSVAQWRENKAHGASSNTSIARSSETAEVAKGAPKQAHRVEVAQRRPSRSAVVAVVLATLSCLMTAVGMFAYSLRQSQGGPPDPLEAFALVAIPVSLVGATSAVVSFRIDFRQNARLSVPALLGCLVPWVVIFVYGG